MKPSQEVFWSTPKEPPTFSLPATEMPEDLKRSLSPWVAGFLGLTPIQATERLHDRWKGIARPSLKSLRDTLSEFRVVAIVVHGDGGMIKAIRLNSEDHIGNKFYLPAPIDEEELNRRLEQVELDDNDAVREFMTHFAGMAEDTIAAGQFAYLEDPWRVFDDRQMGKIEGFNEWENAFAIYLSRGGCEVLVRSDGAVAWYVMQEHRVAPYTEEFDAFIERFNEHRKISWPFDAYAPPDYALSSERS